MNRNRGSKKRILISILIGLLLIGAFALVLHLLENRSLEDVQFGDTGEWGDDEEPDVILLTYGDEDYYSNDAIEAYLIAGTDAGGTDLGEAYSGELADFITVLIINNTNKKYGFYQIDRNSMVDVPVISENGDFEDFSYEQICTAHWYGRDAYERNNNLANATTELLGGIDMNEFFVLNMEDIALVNDAIGGVDVDIEEDMTNLDPAFTKGAKVHLNGKQAESFLRARMDVGEGTNAERMARQRQYMQNAYNMVISQLRENPEYINDLYNQLEASVDSEASAGQVSKIGQKMIEYESVGILTFDGEHKEGDTIGEGIIHEEFYADPQSILSNLRKVMTIDVDDSEDEDEADDEDEDDAEDYEDEDDFESDDEPV